MATGEEPEIPLPPKKQTDPNMIIAIALAIISLCALVVSIYQTKISVDQQRLSTQAEKAQLWPRIECNFGGVHDGKGYTQVSLKLENVGTGPAIINDFSIYLEGEPQESWAELFHELRGSQSMDGVTFVNQVPTHDVLKAGESTTIFKLVPDRPDSLLAVMKAFEDESKTSISICYESVFGDQWSLAGSLIEDLVAEPGCVMEK